LVCHGSRPREYYFYYTYT